MLPWTAKHYSWVSMCLQLAPVSGGAGLWSHLNALLTVFARPRNIWLAWWGLLLSRWVWGKSWAHLGVIWSPRREQGPASSISLGVPPWQNNIFPDSAQQLFWLQGNSWGWHASPLLPLDTQGAWGTAEAWVEGEEVSGALITEFTLQKL